jgi:hypothetical protein
MDLIKTDQYGRQIGYVQGANIDFEVGADEATVLMILRLSLSVGIGMGLLDMELEYFHRILSMAELSEKSAPIQVPM